MRPYTTLALTPYTITGPAIWEIWAPTPRMKPSACVNLGPISVSSWISTCYGFISLIKAGAAVKATGKGDI